MSLTASVPSVRGQCVEHTDHAFCLCSHFVPARDVNGALPVLITSQAHLCACGHGVHAHVDYVSPVVHHCPSTRCAAFAQQTLQTQDCICGAPLADHAAIVNPYRVPGLVPHMPESSVNVQNIGTPSNVGTVSPSDNMSLVLSPWYSVPSPHNLYPPGTQLVITPADASSSSYPHLSNTADDDAANGRFYDPNVMYSTTSND
ncbi:hypothetical protein EDD18DRAFT_1135084 [Armillaria luteobubalina]|uniref:Uncharacterized protein n=1 Tax=Armillaria luteobubalina TaxID=153913 RepID=A0AA39UTM4_9AGAR|nr:hypothetical protein EDD18DRAFT_1135084 [Armillaria luteobubalina]